MAKMASIVMVMMMMLLLMMTMAHLSLIMPTPTYLGVKLDRQLTYKEHLKSIRAKVSSRNNLLRRLAGSKWGACATTLRTSALALVYSAAEYASPAWCRSSHAKKLDTALNDTMRLITGCLRPTPTAFLPVTLRHCSRSPA